MKRNIIIAGIVVVCAGLGIFALIKIHGASSGGGDESDDDNVETIVTVQVGALKQMTLHSYVTGFGTIEAAPAIADQPAAGASLAAATAGIVSKVNVVAGETVKKGDILLELDSAAATYKYAKAEVERQRQLFKQQNTSLKNLQDAEAQLASLQVVAPVSGTVTAVNVRPGQAVDPTTMVAEVIDLDRLATAAKFPAAQANDLKTGEEMNIETEKPVTATVTWVNRTVDPNDGTVSAWALLPSSNGLMPGQFVPLSIVTGTHTNCLAAPVESVVTDEQGNSSIALVHDDEATNTPVQTGFRESGWVEVSAPGLKAGDIVVTVGAYGLPDQTKIHIVNPADQAGSTNSSDAK